MMAPAPAPAPTSSFADQDLSFDSLFDSSSDSGDSQTTTRHVPENSPADLPQAASPSHLAGTLPLLLVIAAPPSSSSSSDAGSVTLLGQTVDAAQSTHSVALFSPDNTMAGLSQLPNVEGLSMGDSNAQNDGEPDDSVAAFWANAMDHGHEDLITAMKHNFDGTRFLTASSDHRVKVYHKVEGSDDEMVLDDTWTAHDAEVRDADWGGYFTGTHIGTVGEDMKFKLWEEDTSQACNSGRRFKCVFSATSPTRQPWVSLCFKQIDLDSWVALISRDGFLMIMEPSMPQTFTDWHVLEQFQVGPKPPRGEETSFKVTFHQDKHDITHAILGDSQLKSLSLAVAAMDTVMIFRSRDPASGNSGPLYLAAELKGHGGLVRSVSWANGSARGYDLIATGCKDGKIRIFELRTVLAPADRTPVSSGAPASTAAAPRPVGARSGIGEVFGGNSTPQTADRDNGSDSRVKHTVTEVACIESHDDVWQVGFEPYGDTLASSGDDGAVKLWKKSIDGEWIEYGEIEAEEEE